MTKAEDSVINTVKNKLQVMQFKNRLSFLEEHIELFNKRDLVKLFGELRSTEVIDVDKIEKFNLLSFLMRYLQWQYGVDFSISEMVYTLLNEGEQEYFLKIIDTSSYPYIKLNFEADEVRRRVWEKKLYFNFFNGNVVEIELYDNNMSNANSLKKNLRRLKKFKNLQKLNLLFFRGYPSNLIRTRVSELKAFRSLKKAKIYEFDEGNPIPVQVKFR